MVGVEAGRGAGRRPAAVLFDLHDTLACLAPSTDDAMGALVGLSGPAFREAWREVDRRIAFLAEGGLWPPRHDGRWPARWAALYGLLVEILDLDEDPADLAARFDALFKTPASYEAFPDSAGVLAALRDAGLRVGVVSNSDFDLWPVLAHAGLAGHVEAAVPALLHGTAKPAPEAFALGLEALRVGPADCWFVGDHLEDDVAASTRLGMTAILVDRAGRHAGEVLPFPVVADLRPVPSMLGL